MDLMRVARLHILAPKGRLVLVGLTDKPLTVTDGTRFSYLQHQILGHYGSAEDAVPQLVALAEGGRLDFSRSITDVLPLADTARARPAPARLTQVEIGDSEGYWPARWLVEALDDDGASRLDSWSCGTAAPWFIRVGG